MGVDEERRGFRVVLDGARKYVVSRSVTFYEQALVQAMRTSVGIHPSDASGLQVFQPNSSAYSSNSEGPTNSASVQHQSGKYDSSADTSESSGLKVPGNVGRPLETSWKASLMTPPNMKPNSLRVEPAESAQPKPGGSTPDSGGNSLW